VLDKWLVQNGECDKCIFIAPGSIPLETIFTPYDVAKFLYTTFIFLDESDRFIILSSDYFSGDQFTSVWTEAEALMWSYYDRDMFLSAHHRKEKFYTIATPDSDNSRFNLSRKNLLNLDEATNALLVRAAMDFAPRIHQMPPSYSELSYLYVFSCNNCGANSLITKEVIKKSIRESKIRYCQCGNSFRFYKVREYFTAQQKQERNIKQQSIKVAFVLRLLFSDRSPFPIIYD
jgi:hypothetical protein